MSHGKAAHEHEYSGERSDPAGDCMSTLCVGGSILRFREWDAHGVVSRAVTACLGISTESLVLA